MFPITPMDGLQEIHLRRQAHLSSPLFSAQKETACPIKGKPFGKCTCR